MTTGRLNQAPPDRARELFEKLLATSDGSVRTRERLFADLQDELRLLATLQEQHLLPVLRRHGMDDLVRQAIDDNEETASLLAEIEAMPKNDGGFLTKIAELRRVFQQHIRDDRKELLPAVLKVLSEDEAEAVLEKVEDDMAAMDETKRIDARRARDDGATAKHMADTLIDTARVGDDTARTVTRTMQQAMENSLGLWSELARRSTGQAVQMFGRPEGEVQGLSERVADNLRTLTQSNAAMAQSLQDVSREWLERSQKRLQTNLEGLNALARCRSMNDFVNIQSSLIRDNLEQTVDNGRRMAELTMELANQATRSAVTEVEQLAKRTDQAA